MRSSSLLPIDPAEHAASTTPLPPDLIAPAPRPRELAKKRTVRQRLALVTDVLYALIFPTIAWLVLSRGFRAPSHVSYAISIGIALAASMWLLADYRALRRAERLLIDGIATKGRVLGRRGLAVEAVFFDQHGAPVQTLFLPTLGRAKGESFPMLYFPEETAVVACKDDRVVSGMKRAAPLVNRVMDPLEPSGD